jgi:hypothetical protein
LPETTVSFDKLHQSTRLSINDLFGGNNLDNDENSHTCNRRHITSTGWRPNCGDAAGTQSSAPLG